MASPWRLLSGTQDGTKINIRFIHSLVPGLSGAIVGRLRSELGGRAYNLREAVNHAVEEQDAAEGGLSAVLDAWQRFKAQTDLPGADVAAARSELDQVLSRVKADKSRAS